MLLNSFRCLRRQSVAAAATSQRIAGVARYSTHESTTNDSTNDDGKDTLTIPEFDQAFHTASDRRKSYPTDRQPYRTRSNDPQSSSSLSSQSSQSQSSSSSQSQSQDTRTMFRRDRPGPRESPFIYVQVHGLSCTLDDIYRLLRSGGYRHSLPYDHVLHRIRRVSQTLISMSFRDVGHANHARRVLNECSLNGVKIRSYMSTRDSLPPKYDPLHVSEESGPGRAVSVFGLPSAVKTGHMRQDLGGYDLIDNSQLQFHLIKLSPGTESSAWLVRLKTQEEAQRMVRNLHRTHYKPDKYGQKFAIRAEIFY